MARIPWLLCDSETGTLPGLAFSTVARIRVGITGDCQQASSTRPLAGRDSGLPMSFRYSCDGPHHLPVLRLRGAYQDEQVYRRYQFASVTTVTAAGLRSGRPAALRCPHSFQLVLGAKRRGAA